MNQASRSRSSRTIGRWSTPRQTTWYQAGLGSWLRGILGTGPTLPRCLLARNRREGTTSRDSPSDTSFADAGRADWRLMRALLDYRSEFPILEETTYLINHSLGAMPRRAEDGLAEYARTWRERGIRAWGEGWWELPLTVGDQIGRIVGAPAGTTVMHQNVAIAEAVVLSCFRPTPAAEPGRLRARQLPLGALPLPGAARTGGRGLRGRRRDRRRDRRANAARPGQPRPLQVG